MEFVFTPWKGRLIADLQGATREIILVCPYITKVIADEIFDAVADRGVNVMTVSRFERAEFLAGSSDLDAHYALSGVSTLRELSGTFELRALPKVHAKMFLIDGRLAYVGSSNLTFSGLLKNYEGTVRISEADEVARLRLEILTKWPKLRRIERQDFVEMLGKLQGASQSKAARVAAEHFYDVHASIEGEDLGQAGEDFRRAVEESTEASQGRPATESVGAPSIDEIVNDSLGISAQTQPVRSDGHPADEHKQRPFIEVLREHARIVRRFLEVLGGRFGVDVSRNPTGYARVLKTKACSALWSDDSALDVDFGPVDARSLYLESNERIYNVGVAAYELCVAHVAAKSGILSGFGTEIASNFRQKALTDPVLLSAWRHNLLGPQLYAYDAERYNERFALRTIRQATFKLYAELVTHEGLERTLQIFEEYFNPVDVLGTDAVSLVDFEAAKTTLQNLAQRHGWAKPTYPPSTSEGALQVLVWHGYAQMLGLSATGSGRRQKDAENAAATELLQRIESSPKWAWAVKEYRAEQLDKAYNSHQPLFPKVELEPSAVASFALTASAVFGLRIKPSLGFVALVDNETRRAIQAPASNETMSWFGSYVLNLLISTAWDDAQRMDSPELRKKLFGLFKTNELRSSVGITVPVGDVAHQGTIVNALCCALYFSAPFDEFSKKLIPIVTSAAELIPKPSVFDPFDRTALNELLRRFNPAAVYTRYIQEITQSRDRTLPEYAVTDVNNVPHGREDAVGLRGTWHEHSIVVRAKNKAIARNLAAYELCKLIATDDSLWSDLASEFGELNPS